MSKIILTGDRPTGRLHVGHYVGSLKERVKLQNSGEYDEIYIMIADAQALTDNAEHPEKVRQNIMNVALDYLACGIDPEKCHIFIQSMVPELTELTFYYMNLVTVSRVQRNPTVKAEIQQRNFEATLQDHGAARLTRARRDHRPRILGAPHPCGMGKPAGTGFFERMPRHFRRAGWPAWSDGGQIRRLSVVPDRLARHGARAG